ncbi:UNVERIFIED_CONTAM: hypothetical protein HDU68_012671 [Siphonaria sp. JEL0065]|nr:hypothetical protein HDU68_012671 [Siphonaria sp. JEL0065]
MEYSTQGSLTPKQGQQSSPGRQPSPAQSYGWNSTRPQSPLGRYSIDSNYNQGTRASDAIIVDSGVQLPADPAVGSGPKCVTETPKNLIEHGDCKIRIEGDLVPVVDVWLGGQQGVFFEHHTLSRDGVGQIVALQLVPGDSIDVREHQFVLASANLHYSVTALSGGSSVLFPTTGMFVDTFTAGIGQEGVVLIHGYGNVFEKTLGDGECIDIEPGAWLWKDGSVQLQPIVVGQTSQTNVSQSSSLNSSFGGLGKLVGLMHSSIATSGFRLTRFIGPGRVALQSMTHFAPHAEVIEKKANDHYNSTSGSMSSFAQF